MCKGYGAIKIFRNILGGKMIYAYFRVSTQTQQEHNSTQMQEVAVNNYCKANNIVLSGSYSDLGISGTVIERDGLFRLLSVLNKGDKVLVLNTSRLWRNDTAKILIQKELKARNVDVISIEQPTYSIYNNDPNDYLINAIMEVLDCYDRLQIAMKLSNGRKAKAVKGDKPCGSLPYGYKWDNNSVVIDYNNHLVIQDIFENYAYFLNDCTLKYPLSKLALYCEEKGYKTHSGNAFSKQTLSNIIKNDFYIGIVTHDGKKVKGNHEPIISKELFTEINPDYDTSIMDD